MLEPIFPCSRITHRATHGVIGLPLPYRTNFPAVPFLPPPRYPTLTVRLPSPFSWSLSNLVGNTKIVNTQKSKPTSGHLAARCPIQLSTFSATTKSQNNEKKTHTRCFFSLFARLGDAENVENRSTLRVLKTRRTNSNTKDSKSSTKIDLNKIKANSGHLNVASLIRHLDTSKTKSLNQPLDTSPSDVPPKTNS